MSLSRAWRTIFGLEILIVAATCLVWLLRPASLLEGLYGLDADAGAYLLLQQSSNVVFCAYVFLYLRMLRARPFPALPFRWLQEAMALGDVFMLAQSVAMWRLLDATPLLLVAQAGMATLWLGIRVTYLVTTRAPREQPMKAIRA